MSKPKIDFLLARNIAIDRARQVMEGFFQTLQYQFLKKCIWKVTLIGFSSETETLPFPLSQKEFLPMVHLRLAKLVKV